MVRFVTISRHSQISGYSEDAIRTKIRDGVWLQGHEYQKAPDGRILIDLEGYDQWVEQGRGSGRSPRRLTR